MFPTLPVLLTHVAGVDVHKDQITITTLIGKPEESPRSETFEAKTFTQDLIAVGQKLLNMGIEHVVMESTGIYWKPVYNVWQPMGLKITLANAHHVKNVPGRKTDVKDSQWLAVLHRMGLVRPSFIPNAEFQQLRLLNRHRQNLVEDLAKIKNRVQKVLEDGNLKLGCVVSDVFGAAGLAVLTALSENIVEPKTLLSRIHTQHRLAKKEDLSKALSHSLTKNHLFLLKQLMLQFKDLTQRIEDAESHIDACFEPYIQTLERLDEIPGIDRVLAQNILAETTDSLDTFNDDRVFAAWAGVAPGNNESAGKKKDPRLEREILT